MASPLPHISSAQVQGTTPAALHTLLSELSFTAEIPAGPPLDPEDQLNVLNGLFCLNFEEGANDLFFDAQQEINTGDPSEGESKNASVSRAVAIAELRGGDSRQSQQDMFLQQAWGPVTTQNSSDPSQSESNESSDMPSSHPMVYGDDHNPYARLRAPPPPEELPLRFLRAGKGDPVEGQRRYEATLKWRAENGIDTILTEPHPNFELIKANYPHYFHLRGRNGEPVFFEQPPKTNLQAMRVGGVTLDGLLHHYAMVTEYQWQAIERGDMARSITILDLEGMRMMDFVGECVDYVRKCSEFTGQHYPERAGFVYVINVPGWFAMIWNVVKPMVDEVTLKKINILRGKEQIFNALLEKIPIENIPPEYGGQSMPLGQSPEEHALRELIMHNNALACGDFSCGGKAAKPPCEHCSFRPTRSY